jgi:hypothetical protein
MLKQTLALLFLIGAVALGGFAQSKTVIRDQKAAKMLLGRHKASLQWISWDYFGTANVIDRKGIFYLTGEQKGRKSTDLVRIDGVITSIDEREFIFNGTIVTQVTHINGGNPCTREGEMTFRITGKRKYWRLQSINNPCDEVADYVDIYFR